MCSGQKAVAATSPHEKVRVRVRVRVTGDARITGVLEMGMPKTRGYPYHSDSGSPPVPARFLHQFP